MHTLRLVLATFLLGCITTLFSQSQTVGLFLNSADAFNGYTLFAPLGTNNTYLINNCGEKVHEWLSTYRPGQAVYVLENGTLLRTGNTGNTTFNGGGLGGIIEMIDWSGTVIWSYTISSTTECHHHDIEFLPNGNILVIVWDAYTQTQANTAGRTTSGNSLWAEKIIEIEPNLITGGANIVWEWKAWDHLVQDENATANNFGNVANSPELIDLNFVEGSATDSDWLHFNSVDYNEKLDQIAVSNHNFSEVWFIDHSTTTAEAATHAGGNSGKGGDLLYRWGNPRAYQTGTVADQKLFAQHNAYWIDSGFVHQGSIMVFNNQVGSNYSTVDVFQPSLLADGSYSINASTGFGPLNFQWTYTASPQSDFYAQNISGAQRQPNGNTLICSGPSGRFFEVDINGNMVWEYINPVSGQGIIAQGATANNNRAFRAERYATDYAGFTGQTLTPQGYIESGSTFSCVNYASTIETLSLSFTVYPNPATAEVKLNSKEAIDRLTLLNLSGKKVMEKMITDANASINVSGLPTGIYFLQVRSITGKTSVQKLSVQ